MKYIRTIRDSSYIKRFHNTVTHSPYNVGFHTYNAMVIAHHLLMLNKTDRVSSYYALSYLMVHDVHELYTGDIPGDFKWQNEQITSMLKEVEDKWEKENLPKYFYEYKSFIQNKEELCLLLKQSDLLELAFFISDEILLGNKRIRVKLELVLDTSKRMNRKLTLKGVRELINFIDEDVRKHLNSKRTIKFYLEGE